MSPALWAVLASVKDGKITFLAVCGKDAVAAGVKAGDIIRQVTALTGGKGGGKPTAPMGGGHDLLMLDNALAMVDNFGRHEAWAIERVITCREGLAPSLP